MNFNAILSFFAKAGRSFADEFYLNFIKDSRWKYLTDGLGNTLIITMGALILGIALDSCWPWFAPPTIRPASWDS